MKTTYRKSIKSFSIWTNKEMKKPSKHHFRKYQLRTRNWLICMQKLISLTSKSRKTKRPEKSSKNFKSDSRTTRERKTRRYCNVFTRIPSCNWSMFRNKWYRRRKCRTSSRNRITRKCFCYVNRFKIKTIVSKYGRRRFILNLFSSVNCLLRLEFMWIMKA